MIRPHHVLAALLCLSPAAASETPRHWGRDRTVDVQHVRIELAVDLDRGRIEGATTLDVTGLLDGTRVAELDAVDLDVSSAHVDGRPAALYSDGETIRIPLDPPLGAGETAAIRVEYSASPQAGLFFVRPGTARPVRQLQAWTQGETEDNRRWFPVIDHPSERMTSETVITVRKPLEVVGNGTLLGVDDHGDGTWTWHHRMDFPHVAYLVSLAIADWADRRETWNGVELSYHVPQGREADVDRTFAHTAGYLQALADLTGVPYPWPVYRQVAVSDFMFGGMENITATTLTDQTLHDERAHSDWPSDTLVAHEAAHQWFGNAVTCEDWSEAWINEGFATYYAALAVGEVHGPVRLAEELDDLRRDAVKADAGESRRPVATNAWVEPFDLFDGHAYAKGAMVLHALRREIGEPGFRQAIRVFLERHWGRSVATHDLEDAIERSTGRDVTRFFAQWIHGAGQPDLETSWRHADGHVILSVKQVQPESERVGTFDVPLDVAILHGDAVAEHVVRLDAREAAFRFPAVERPEAVVVDPAGWLLSTQEADRPVREAAWVLRHAPWTQARMDAARGLADEAARPAARQALIETLASQAPWPVRREAAAALGRSSGEEARQALRASLAADEESQVRAAAAAALGELDDAGSAEALERALGDDPSYAVRAAAAAALATIEPPGVEGVLERALRQRSHREEVFKAALLGLASVQEEAAVPAILAWTAEVHETPRRNHAAAALAQAAEHGSPRAIARARERLVELLEDPTYSTRQAAVAALGDLGDAEALPELQRLAESSPVARLRREARRAAEEVGKAAGEDAKLARLSKELREEKEAREKLERRVRELEERLPEDADQADK